MLDKLLKDFSNSTDPNDFVTDTRAEVNKDIAAVASTNNYDPNILG